MFISISKLIRENMNFKSYFSDKMTETYNSGGIHPNIVASAFCLMEILKQHSDQKLIVVDGLPRHREQFLLIKSLVDQNYLESFTVIEIKTPNQICKNRLIERTSKDKRIDLSIDNQPGKVDYQKIAKKMEWWTKNRRSLIDTIKKNNMYLCLENTGTLNELKEKIVKIL